MSDFGADVFDQDRPKAPKHGAPPETLAPPVTNVAPSQPARAPAAALPEPKHRAEAVALPPVPVPSADPRDARPVRDKVWREPDERLEPAPKVIPSLPPRRGPADHHGAPHKERHTEFRSTHEPGEPRRQRASPAREPVRAIERPASPPATAPRTVGLLVDLEGLQAEARAQQGELAMHRLRSGLGSGRTVAKALAIAKNAGAAPSGFDLIVSSGGFAAGVQFAAAAVELLRLAPVLVMAPTSDPIRKLASALRAAGHTVELAGFAATEASTRRLGRDCLFVP